MYQWLRMLTGHLESALYCYRSKEMEKFKARINTEGVSKDQSGCIMNKLPSPRTWCCKI